MREQEEIRRADRKALPRLLLFVLAGTLAGFEVGFGCVFLLGEQGMDRLIGGMAEASELLSLAAPWLLLLCVAAQLSMGLILCGRAKKLIAGWDGEAEGVSDRAERLLEWELSLSALLNILSFLLLTALYADQQFTGWKLLGLGAFVAHLAIVVLFQTRAVNLTKRLYPEKKASALDPRFRKKWLADCDEAEKAMIGDCAYRAFSAISSLCMALWCILTITALLLGTGILPVFTVCLIWAVGQVVYTRQSMKLSKSVTSIMPS